MQILSLQSSVAYGHVGNSAAVFPLQRSGVEVWPVDTVQFSNHPGYGPWRGEIADPAHLRAIIEGLDRLGMLATFDGVLSGYLGDPGSAEAVALAVEGVRRHRPQVLYLCDPVMGDRGSGIYVRSGIPEAMAHRLLPLASVVTPNSFELELLSGQAAKTVAEAVVAARSLLDKGPRLVIVKGLEQADTLTALAVSVEGAWAVETPRLSFPEPVNGAGDMLAGLVLGRLLAGSAPPQALSAALSSLWGVLERTLELGRRELALVDAQERIVNPPRRFAPLLLSS